MGSRRGAATSPDYLARLRGGPDDGDLVPVAALPGGAPPDFFHAGPADPGMYVLAGLPHEDGSMPYWFISSQNGSSVAPARSAHSTSTLISAASDGSLMVWHQHGDGGVPVPLQAAALPSSQLPSVGRVYDCPECDDTTAFTPPEG